MRWYRTIPFWQRPKHRNIEFNTLPFEQHPALPGIDDQGRVTFVAGGPAAPL